MAVRQRSLSSAILVVRGAFMRVLSSCGSVGEGLLAGGS